MLTKHKKDWGATLSGKPIWNVNDRLGELGIAQLDPSGPMNNIYI